MQQKPPIFYVSGFNSRNSSLSQDSSKKGGIKLANVVSNGPSSIKHDEYLEILPTNNNPIKQNNYNMDMKNLMG